MTYYEIMEVAEALEPSRYMFLYGYSGDVRYTIRTTVTLDEDDERFYTTRITTKELPVAYEQQHTLGRLGGFFMQFKKKQMIGVFDAGELSTTLKEMV